MRLITIIIGALVKIDSCAHRPAPTTDLSGRLTLQFLLQPGIFTLIDSTQILTLILIHSTIYLIIRLIIVTSWIIVLSLTLNYIDATILKLGVLIKLKN